MALLACSANTSDSVRESNVRPQAEVSAVVFKVLTVSYSTDEIGLVVFDAEV